MGHVAGEAEEVHRGGVVCCYFAPRPNSYDHERHARLREEGKPQREVRLPVWDFVIEWDDGTAVRLPPSRSTPRIETFELEGPYGPIAPPPNGCVMGYRHYNAMHARLPLKFDASKGSSLPPLKLPVIPIN